MSESQPPPSAPPAGAPPADPPPPPVEVEDAPPADGVVPVAKHAEVVRESRQRKAKIRELEATVAELRGKSTEVDVASVVTERDALRSRVHRLELVDKLKTLTDGRDGRPSRTSDRVLELLAADVEAEAIEASELDGFVKTWSKSNAPLFVTPAAAPPASAVVVPGVMVTRAPAPESLDPEAELAAWSGLSIEQQREEETRKPGTRSRMQRMTTSSIVAGLRKGVSIGAVLLALLGALASVGSAQVPPDVARFGASYAWAHFTTSTQLADSTCHPIPDSVVSDLFVAQIEHRRVDGAPADTAWHLTDVEYQGHPTGGVLDLAPAGGERVAFRYRPPTSGLWQVRVVVYNQSNRRGCDGASLFGFWNLTERPVGVDLDLGP